MIGYGPRREAEDWNEDDVRHDQHSSNEVDHERKAAIGVQHVHAGVKWRLLALWQRLVGNGHTDQRPRVDEDLGAHGTLVLRRVRELAQMSDRL